jgi:hypothetical protein
VKLSNSSRIKVFTGTVPVVSGEKVLGELPHRVEGGEVQLDEVNVVVAAQLAQLPQRRPRPLPAPEIEKN